MSQLGPYLQNLSQILDFLTNHAQPTCVLQPNPEHRSTSELCAEPPPLHPLHSRLSSQLHLHPSITNTTVIRLNSHSGESAHGEEVRNQAAWCSNNNQRVDPSPGTIDHRGGVQLQVPLGQHYQCHVLHCLPNLSRTIETGGELLHLRHHDIVLYGAVCNKAEEQKTLQRIIKAPYWNTIYRMKTSKSIQCYQGLHTPLSSDHV